MAAERYVADPESVARQEGPVGQSGVGAGKQLAARLQALFHGLNIALLLGHADHVPEQIPELREQGDARPVHPFVSLARSAGSGFQRLPSP